MEKKSYAWCFTAFTEEEATQIASLPNRVCVIAKEIAPSTGTVHYQGYVRFPRQQRFSWWKNQFPKVHVEVRCGSEWEAVSYINDVAMHNSRHPDKEEKIQGEIVCEYGEYERYYQESDKNKAEEKAIQMLAEGAPLWQVHKAVGPKYVYHNYRKMRDYHEFITFCRENKYDYI